MNQANSQLVFSLIFWFKTAELFLIFNLKEHVQIVSFVTREVNIVLRQNYLRFSKNWKNDNRFMFLSI